MVFIISYEPEHDDGHIDHSSRDRIGASCGNVRDLAGTDHVTGYGREIGRFTQNRWSGEARRNAVRPVHARDVFHAH